jgi:hypothetical protein
MEIFYSWFYSYTTGGIFGTATYVLSFECFYVWLHWILKIRGRNIRIYKKNINSGNPLRVAGPDPWSGMNFFRIPDLFDYEWLRLCSWKHKKQEKISLPSTFHVESGMEKCLDPDPGWENGRIWDKTSRVRNTESTSDFIKNILQPGSQHRTILTAPPTYIVHIGTFYATS